MGRLTKISPPSPDAATTIAYSSATQTNVTRPGGGDQIYLYDGFGRLAREIRQMRARYAVRVHVYDLAGHANFVSEWDACDWPGTCSTLVPAGTTSANFDALGRPGQVTRADASVTTYAYSDGAGSTVVTSSVSGSPAATTTIRDALGRVIHVTEPHVAGISDPNTTDYTYSVLDKLASVTQGAQGRTFTYDVNGMLRTEITPEKGTVQYTRYDATGGLLISSDARPVTLTRAYDSAGRLLTLSSSDGRTYVTNSYDGNFASYGQISSSSSLNHTFNQGDFTVTETYSYDPATSRLLSRATLLPGVATAFTTSWAYNSLGLVSTLTQQSGASVMGSLAYAYTNGFLTSINGTPAGLGATSVLTDATYTPAGGINTYSLGNSVTTTITPDGVMPRPRQISVSGGRWDSGVYTYDGVGNITAIGTDTYAYDAVSRLSSATILGTPYTFVYDRWGNLTKKGPTANPQTFVMDPGLTNRLQANGLVAYDAVGNLTNYGGGQVFRYDSLSRETDFSSSSPSVQESYVYDAAGERVARAATLPALLPILVTGDTEWSVCSDPTHTVSQQATLMAALGTAPYTWVITTPAGQYPSWITLSSAGAFSAIVPIAAPTATYTIAVKVTDASGRTGTATLKLMVSSACLHWLYEPQDEILCTGELFGAAALADAGGATISYQWQQGDANGNFTDIPGKTSATISIAPTAGVSFYRVRAFLATGAEIISQVATASFNVPIQQHLKLFGGNTVSFCLGAPAIDLSQFLYAIGGDLQMGWQQQLGDGTWQDVQGNNIAPTQTTTYRAKLVAFCPPQTVYSDSIVLLVSPPPSFTAAPPSQNFCAGSTVNLSASANVPSFFKWQRFDVPTITWITIQNGATQTSTSTLSVNPTATTAYRVIATNYCGVAESDFTLTQLTLPVVTGPTANITICPPLAYTLTTTVTNAVSQKWQLSADGFTWVDIPGATGTNYATPVFTTSGTYYYRIQATNTCGTVTNTSTITVLTQPPAYISGACSVSSGQSTTLTANTDFTATSFAWTPGGQSTQSITVSPTTTTTYTCAVRGSNGCPRFVSYTVNVGTRTDPPVITAGPPNVTICNGVAPTLSVTATGSNLLYQWQKPGMATGLWHLDENIGTIAGDSSGSGYTGGVTGTTIAPGRYSNSRVFATATDKITVSSAPNLATAGAISLEAWVRPTDLSNWNIVLVKQRAADPTSYAGNYELMIQPTTGSVWFSHLDSTGTARNYHSTGAVVVGIWSHIVATWQPGSPGQVQFYINGLPAGASADVSEGSAATTADPVTIGWRADGLHFTGQIDEVAVWKYARSANEIASAYGAAPDGWGGLPAATASTYTAPSSNASYRVQVSNACGVVNSGMATVTVSSNTPASIVTQPQSGFYCSGGSKTLTVVAAGTSPVYSWESYDPATSSWRYFSNTASVSVSPTIATQYRVTVSNSCNAVISNTVTVTPATLPTIVRQPVGGNACPPGLSLNVVAASDGDPDIHYQWRVNGTNIPGATAWTYLASSSGSYDVIVSNTCGSRTSTAAIANIQNCGFMATGPGAGTTSFYGVYDPATGNVTLDHGSADRLSARTIPVGRRGLVVVGDWDGDGVASLGFYDRRLGVFELWNGDPIGTGDYKFAFGPVGVDWQPVAGDWDGDGIDTVGLVNTATGDVLLRNTNSAGIADLSYRLRVGPKSGSAVAGDWTSKGYDTVGVYEPTSATFSLWDTHAGGGADHAIGVTANSKTSTPVAGDWSGNELASVGLFDPASGEIRVWYSLRPGTPDRTVVFAAGASASTQAFAGRWNGTKHAPGGRKTSRARPAGTQTAAMDSVETGPVPDLHAGPEPDLAQSSLAHHRGGSWVSRGFTLASNRTRVFGLVASRTSGTKSPQVAGLANGQTWFYTIRDQANRPSIQYHLDQSGNVIVDRFNAFFGDSLVASYESYQPTPEWTYYGSDHLGSARLVSGSAGNTLATPRYLPYGEAVSPPGANPEQFAGLERDVATAYDYDHARYATSTLGRFLAPDYLGGMTSIPQTWNRYSYARNNSLNAVDPNGLNATAYIIGTGMHEVNELGGHVMVAVSSDRGTGFLSKTTTLPDFHPGVPNAQVMEYLAEGRSVTEVTLRSTPAFDRALYDRISTHNYGAYDLLFNNCGESVCRSLITAGFPSQLLRVPLAPFLVENALVDSPFVLKVTHMYSYLDLGGMYNVRYDIVLFTNTQLTLDYHPAPTLARSIFDLLLTMQNIRIDGTTLAQ